MKLLKEELPYLIAVVLITMLIILTAKTVLGSEPCRAAPQPQCVRVIVKDKDTRSKGSGAYIAPRIIVTAWHVVKDRKSDDVEVLFPDWQLVAGKVVNTDSRLDVAIIRLNESPKGVKPLELSPGLKDGEPMSIQGYGYAPYKQSWGVLSSVRYGSWRKVVGADARSGDSGGPIIDSMGRYCGTLWGSVDGETYFTPSQTIEKMFVVDHPVVN